MFSAQIPPRVRERIRRPDGSSAYTTYDTSTVKREADDYSVEIYYPSTPCSPSLTGASEMQELPEAGGRTGWGRVDERQAGPFKPYPEALCTIPLGTCSKEDYWEGGCHTGAAAYALCSEKDGKTVLLCISQVTDDPELAGRIFRTFRWIPQDPA